jgi:hypothetical protein
MRLQWSATAGGTYADVSGTGSTPTTTVETDKRSYTGYDPVGTGVTWYRTRFENTGATRVSDWSPVFQVGETGGLYPDYASLDEMRTFLKITDVADIDDDLQIALAVTSASRAVDRATDRQFGLLTTAAARYYRPVWSDQHGRWLAHIDDLMSSTSLVVKSDTDDNATYETTITDYRLWPLNAASDGKPWREIVLGTGASIGLREGSLEVTALWGWSAVPATVKNATLIQASRFLKRRDSPFGIAGSPDLGNELRLLAKVDPDVAVMLMPYRVWTMI